MSILTTTTRTLPRAAIEKWLSGVRLPVTVAEAVLRRGKDTEDWPPTLAFASFEASVKQVFGSVLRDERLLDEGRLEQARVGQLRKAAELDAVAETKRQAADAEFSSTLEETDEQRQQARERAEQRKEQIARDAQARKSRVEQEAANAERKAETVEARTNKLLEREQRAADLTRVSAEQDALTERREAAEAKRKVAETDDQIEVAKAVRRAKR